MRFIQFFIIYISDFLKFIRYSDGEDIQMKIIEHTSDTLLIRDCPGRILFAAFCVLAIAGACFVGLADSFTSTQNGINEYSTTLVLLFSLIGLAIGGCIIYDCRLIYTKFNKDLHTAFVHKIGILKFETSSYRLDDIEDIIITKSRRFGESCFYRVVLKLKDSRKIPISGACWLNDEEMQESSDAAREFLNTKAWQFSHSRMYELMSLSCRAI